MKKTNAEYTEYSAYTADGKLLYVERSLKNGTDELTEYIWAGSTLWAEKRTTGTESAVYYHHTDYHGSTEAITDEAGVVVWKAGYDAYGNMLEATGVMEFEASYTGKMYDRDTGLYYFNARWYDAELGRFTTPDPARDGTNWVVYCAANPMGRWDPTGLEDSLITKAWTAIKSWFSGDEEDNNTEDSTTEVVTESISPFSNILSFTIACMNYVPIKMVSNSLQTLNYVSEKREEALDWADENWPSWLTLTGSVRTDLEAIGPALMMCAPEMALAEQSLQNLLPLLESSGIGSQLLLGGNTTSTLGLPAPNYQYGAPTIGHFPDYIEVAQKMNGKVFEIPIDIWNSMSLAEQWSANQKFLDRAIERNESFNLATSIFKVRPGSYYEKEIQYLLKNNYILNETQTMLIPNGK